MRLEIGPAWGSLSGKQVDLERVRAQLMFRDKQAAADLRRFRRNAMLHRQNPEWARAEEARLLSLLDVYATEWADAGLLRVPTGFAFRLSAEAEIVDTRDFSQSRRRHRPADPEFVLRRPQAEALEAMRQAAHANGLLRIATGCGKTAVAQEFFRENGRRALFLVPSKPILEQTVRRFEEAYGKREVGWFYGEGKRHGYVTVATYQSVNAADPSEFDDYAVLVGDETHHIAADTFYNAAMNHVRNAAWRFGLSADEERADGGTVLVEAAIGPCIYEYPAWRAIEDGHLARPTFAVYRVPSTGGTFKSWKTTGGRRECVGEERASEYQGHDAGKAYKHWVLGNDRLTAFVAGMARELAASGQSSLILIDETEHGEKLGALLGREGEDYGFCFGGGRDNDRLLRRFNARELKILVATTTLSEGADTVPVDALFNLLGGLRPKQAVGRALRNETVDGVARKPTSLVIDFDYVNSPVLSRHCEARLEVYRSYRCGEPAAMGAI